MFRATPCSSSGESIVSIQHLVYVTLYRWPSGMQVKQFLPDLNTRRPLTMIDIYQMYWYNWFSWWWARGCSKHVENWNKRIRKETCASSWLFTRIKVPLSTLWRHRGGSRGIDPRILNLGARHGWVVNITPRPLNPRQATPVSTELEADWDPQPSWTFRRKEKSRGPCRDSGPGLSCLYPSHYTDWWIPAPHYYRSEEYHRQLQLSQICSSELNGTHHISLATTTYVSTTGSSLISNR
jgi:hypothetical protein